MFEPSDPVYIYCRLLPGVTEDVKWENNLVFSVGGKMFASFNFPAGEPFGFRTSPHDFAALTQRPGIKPAAYLGKHDWISLDRRDTLPLEQLKDLLHQAHAIVASKLSKKLRARLGID